MTPQQALDLSHDIPSDDMCAWSNPKLWFAYCEITGRDIMPSPHWSEVEVVLSLMLKCGYISEHETDLDHRTV